MSHLPTVLIVEDEALIRMTVAEDLTDAGFRMIEAVNADEALSILEQSTDVRAIFTDIDMPGSCDGVNLAHIVRRRWPTIEILMTSGRRWPTSAQLPTGIKFFPKPYSHDAIISTLMSMIG